MTTLYDDPSEFAEDQLAGFLDLYSDRLRGVPGGVVALREEGAEPQVAVVIGGGSGHYPAFAGTVGAGLAHGAVVGNIFTSPSAAQVYSVAKAANQGRGVILSFGNYAGDNMNFGIAADKLRKEGIDTRIVVVKDDVASAPEFDNRRGIAGDFSVFKVMGAAAAEGLDLDAVEAAGNRANEACRTLGVAFSGCTMPGASTPLFSVPEGHLGLGLGIHGEPGIRDEPLPRASELAATLVQTLLQEAPEGMPAAVAPIVNGLGTTKYEELFLLWGHIAKLLREAGLEIVQPEVGELVTSLDMGGCSLTLMWLDDDLRRWWNADAYTPAYRKQGAPVSSLVAAASVGAAATVDEVPSATPAAVEVGQNVVAALTIMHTTLHSNEEELGRIDAVAGDGDHGRGMCKGIDAALTAAQAAAARNAGGAFVLEKAGQAWAEFAGGTSGVLWGAALEDFGRSLTDARDAYTGADVAAAVEAFTGAILELGKAEIGDKTLVDSLLPFGETLAAGISGGSSLATAWREAAAVATQRAADTAALRPKKGRARPLAEKSVGTPDAGATSLALIVTALGAFVGTETTCK
ncbi:dihydroxyacetone kinase family protein [Micrococcales bacterium 31B]|nr:dihydroxyacetone kinase family protein [Micrococcales bacterium 31B]